MSNHRFFPVGRFYALFFCVVVPYIDAHVIPESQNSRPIIDQAVQENNTLEIVENKPDKELLNKTSSTKENYLEQKQVSSESDPLKNVIPVNPEDPKSFRLMPHKAIYEIKLHPNKKPKDPTVSDVTGKGVIEIVQTKDGWVYKQNLEVQIYYHDGTATAIERNIALWESPTEVNFHIENFRDGASESLLQGRAEHTEEGCRVYFQKPEMDGFIADHHVIFPLEYLKKILDVIEQKKCILSDQVVFDPAYEMQTPVRIDTLIRPLKNLPQKEISLLPSNKRWRLQEALYDIQSTSSIADYEEVNVDIFSTGVIDSMETTWGEGITVVLRLKELTVYQ